MDQDGWIKMDGSRWMDPDGWIKMDGSRWMHHDGCIKMRVGMRMTGEMFVHLRKEGPCWIPGSEGGGAEKKMLPQKNTHHWNEFTPLMPCSLPGLYRSNESGFVSPRMSATGEERDWKRTRSSQIICHHARVFPVHCFSVYPHA